jgi:two-component system response regulator PilR (NtrC family)
VAARKLGAEAYILKPFDVDELRIVVRDALANRRLREEVVRLKREVGQAYGLDRVIGVSQVMASLFEMVRAIAPTSSTVLVTGESGTGKEIVARAIHGLSGRAEGPFVGINCAALPDTLLESELFGHVKGAFTDARQGKKGLFEAASKGTLFLDEVGETSPPMQVKLLRVLQERRIRPVGGTEEMNVDVRVIAATNAPLETLVEKKRFREDLFYRLQVIPIRTPPLRERREDIPLLAQHFLERFAREMGKGVAKISEEAMRELQGFDWPGNVRELENVIERAVALETTEAVLPERLPDVIRAPRRPGLLPPIGDGFSLDAYLISVEAQLLAEALERGQGDRAEAARLLGVSPRSLRYLLQKHGASGDKN